MSQFLEVPATITKQQLAQIRNFYGSVNAPVVTLTPGGDLYAARTLRYVTFVGRWDKQARHFVGGHRFQPLDKPDEAATTFDADSGILP